MPCAALQMKVGSGHSGESPPHFSAGLPACPTWGRAGLPMLWVSPLEQKQLLGWLGVKGHTGICLPCLPAAISLQLSLSLRLQENCSKHQEQVEQSGPRRRRGYLCVFHAVGHLRICRIESTVPLRIVFSVYVRSEGWLPDENSPSVGLPHPSVTGCATCSIALSSSPP